MKFYCSLGWKEEVSYNTSCLWKHSAVFLNLWYRGMWQAILLPNPHAQWASSRDYYTSYLRCALTVEWWIISLALSVAFPLNYLLLQTPPPNLLLRSPFYPLFSLQRDMWVIFGARAVEWMTNQYSAAYMPYLFVTVAVLTCGHSIMLNSVGLTVLFSVYKFQIIQRLLC